MVDVHADDRRGMSIDILWEERVILDYFCNPEHFKKILVFEFFLTFNCRPVLMSKYLINESAPQV